MEGKKRQITQTIHRKKQTITFMKEITSTSKFSVPHSSKNSRIGYAAEPTVMYTIKARFFTSPHA